MVIYDLAQWSLKTFFHSFIQNTHYRQCFTGNVAQNTTGGRAWDQSSDNVAGTTYILQPAWILILSHHLSDPAWAMIYFKVCHVCMRLRRQIITGTETASKANMIHSNAASPKPAFIVLHALCVLKASRGLCSSVACVKFCWNCIGGSSWVRTAP